MCYNKRVHPNQTKTPAGTEVTAVWSGCVYVGVGDAAVRRTCVSGFRHYLTVGFGQLFKTNKWLLYRSLLSCTLFCEDEYWPDWIIIAKIDIVRGTYN